MPEFKYASAFYTSTAAMHDRIVRDWIGAGAAPDMSDTLYALAHFDEAALEAEQGFGLTAQHDTKAAYSRQFEGSDVEGGVDGYDRDELKAALCRLRDEIVASGVEDPSMDNSEERNF